MLPLEALMYSPGGVQAGKKRSFIHFFIFFYWRRNGSNERGFQWGYGFYN